MTAAGRVEAPRRVPASSALSRLAAGARVAAPFLVLAVLVLRLGVEPFTRALDGLTPATVVAALVLGAVATAAQAMRWRAVLGAFDPAAGLSRAQAVRECYRSTLINIALPGGMLGDAHRAWRLRTPRRQAAAPRAGLALRSAASSVRASAGSVVVERLVGTVVLLTATAAAAWPLGWHVAAGAAVWAAAAGLVALPGMRRLSARTALSVLGWTLLATGALVTMFAVAAAALGTVGGAWHVVVMALIVLAGASVPLSVGGFGPREAAAALAFPAIGLTPEAGVTTSAAFGALAVISTLPGAVILLRYPGRPTGPGVRRASP